MDFEVREKNSGCAFAQCAHVVRILVKTPAIRRHESNGSVNRFQIRIGSFPDFFSRQGIDRIERGHLNPEVVSLSAKRTDAACHIQDCFPDQLLRFEKEIPSILFESATEQHDPIKLESARRLLRPIIHSCIQSCRGVRHGERLSNRCSRGEHRYTTIHICCVRCDQNTVRMPLL